MKTVIQPISHPLSQSTGHPAKYWHKLSNDRIQCDVCPHACKLKDGHRGLCFVRMRQGEQIVLTTYGRCSGLVVDPVEKKPLFQFLPGSKVLSFGTAGCNLACKFCQNWNLSKAKSMDVAADIAMPEDIALRAKALGCKSVAFTYNEPTIFLEYAVDTAKECHKLGIKTIAVTNGYIHGAAREEFYANLDAANIDLKGFSEEFYTKITGSRLEPVLDTLLYVHNKTKVWLEVTTLLIPGKNASDAEIDKETKWIYTNLGADVPLHFSAFFPAYKMHDTPATSAATLTRAREIALANGLRYVYTGNVQDPDGANTYCTKCGRIVIGRDWYNIVDYQLDDQGRCKYCGTTCAGVLV